MVLHTIVSLILITALLNIAHSDGDRALLKGHNALYLLDFILHVMIVIQICIFLKRMGELGGLFNPRRIRN